MNNPYPKWFRDEELAEAHANWLQTKEDHDGSTHKPVVKLFTPDAQATWLITEVEPESNDLAFGLCDLGMGFPELGSLSLRELSEVTGPMTLPIERDEHFVAQADIMKYAEAARAKQRIVEL